MNAIRRLRPMLCATALALAGVGARADELRNWFDDPFFAISAARPGCPEPAGPRVTLAERQQQSHRRAEKGTTCWLARDAACERPLAYAYDADIAREIQTAVRGRALFSDASLWVTVQGRVVYVEGCVARDAQAGEIEAFVRALPHVQQAIAIVTADPRSRVPYRLYAPPPLR